VCSKNRAKIVGFNPVIRLFPKPERFLRPCFHAARLKQMVQSQQSRETARQPHGDKNTRSKNKRQEIMGKKQGNRMSGVIY
jgi:hypothetical protein